MSYIFRVTYHVPMLARYIIVDEAQKKAEELTEALNPQISLPHGSRDRGDAGLERWLPQCFRDYELDDQSLRPASERVTTWPRNFVIESSYHPALS
jgi:hypothetical protein